MVFVNEFVPDDKEAIKSILDYQITIKDLPPEQTHYIALGMNFFVYHCFSISNTDFLKLIFNCLLFQLTQ